MTEDNLTQAQAVEPQNMQQQTEKMLPQSEVNDLAGRIRAEAFEKGRAAAMQSQQAPQMQASGAQQMAQGSVSESQVKQMILEQTQAIQEQQARQAMAERVVNEFAGKMELGKEAYPDFEDSVRQMDLAEIPQIVQLANAVGNTHEVMYDLAKNPYKIANLLTLADKSPHLAMTEMQRLSDSIKANKSAAAQVSGVKEPLSQMKPSANTTTGSGQPPSLKDLKSAPWLKR